MTEFPGNPHPRRRVHAPPLAGEGVERRPAHGGRLPARQILVAIQSVRVALITDS